MPWYMQLEVAIHADSGEKRVAHGLKKHGCLFHPFSIQ
jgi:hypothetical protein